MDSQLMRLKPGWMLLCLWAGILILKTISTGVESVFLLNILALAGYTLAWLGYPLILVFASAVIRPSPGLRVIVTACFVIFCAALFLNPSNDSMAGQWLSAVGLISLLCIQIAAARAVVRAELITGLYPISSGFGAWGALFFFPFFGIFYIHKRHKRLFEHVMSNRHLEKSHANGAPSA